MAKKNPCPIEAAADKPHSVPFPDFSPLCAQHWQSFHDGVKLNQFQAMQLFQSLAGLDAIFHLLSNDETDADMLEPEDTSCRLSSYVRCGLISAAVALNSNLHHLFSDLHSQDAEKRQEGR